MRVFFAFSESSFSQKVSNDGIIKPSKPQFSSIGEIQDAQKAQKTLIGDLEKKQWDDLVSGTDDLAMINTQNVANAKQGLVDLGHELTAAYGLGDNGYWNKNRKLDDVVHSVGQQPMTPSQKVVQSTNKPSTSYTPPKNVWEADDWAMHGKQPQPVAPESKKTIAERNVALWKQNHPQKPTDEMYDAQIGYYNNMVTKAQDDYVNAYGQSSKADASDKDWADYSEKVDDYVTQRDAYNRAKMGVDTPAMQGGGGRTVSLSPNDDEPMYVGDEGKPITPTQSLVDDMFNANGAWQPGDGENEVGNNPFGENYYFDEDGNRVSEAEMSDKVIMLANSLDKAQEYKDSADDLFSQATDYDRLAAQQYELYGNFELGNEYSEKAAELWAEAKEAESIGENWEELANRYEGEVVEEKEEEKEKKDEETREGVIAFGKIGGLYIEKHNGSILTHDTNVELTYNEKGTGREYIILKEIENINELSTKAEVFTFLNKISEGRYNHLKLERLADNILSMHPAGGLVDTDQFDFQTKKTDVFGRPLYLETGYTVKEIERHLSDDQSFVEIEYWVFDEDGNEVLHDCYIAGKVWVD